jgi:large subunit ribosomal protein L33
MKKNKGPRIFITLECLKCRDINNDFIRKKGVSRYLTSKNRRNLLEKLSLMKYCCFCNKHTIHKEIK